MQGLPLKTLPLRVVVQGSEALLESLAGASNQMVLSSVETSLEISARVAQADVLVVDLTDRSTERLTAIRELQVQRPVLALIDQQAHAEEAFKAGARGVVLRTRSAQAIAAAVSALANGLTVAEKPMIEMSRSSHGAHAPTVMAPDAAAKEVLTKRENEVLPLLADGLSNKEIAQQLSISEHTAKFHVNSILQKMNAQKRVEAVVRAAKMGLIEL